MARMFFSRHPAKDLEIIGELEGQRPLCYNE